MDLRIAGKSAIVAAASKGLGKAVALELATEGANLTICAREEAALMETAKELTSTTSARVLPVVADVTNPDDINSLVKSASDEYSRIDILITNAGGPPPGLFLDFNDKDWYDAMTLNLLSTIRLCREVIPYMRKANGGRIVNIVSIAAKQPIANLILSNSIRAAVIGFAKTLSNELANDNILVNNVCPGYTLTDRLSSIVQKNAESQKITYEDALKNITVDIPLGRCGTPEEIASLIAFLVSERASYITGTTIQIDGGLLKSLY